MFRHILIPLDGSKLAESCLPAAAWLARKSSARVTLIHVIERNAPLEIHGERHLNHEAEACDYLFEIQEKYFAAQAGETPLQVDRHVHAEEVNNVAGSLTTHSGEFSPDLIVMCAHGRGGLRDRMIGSIAQQVISQGITPVLLFHPRGDTPGITEISRVLLPLDGDPEHEQGMQYAVQFAESSGANLRLLHVIHSIESLPGEQAAASKLLPGASRAMRQALEESACEYLNQRVQSIKNLGLCADMELRHGDPAQEILKSADEWTADAVVLGTHGRAGIGAFWAGSVASKVVVSSSRPLLLVPVRK